MQRGLVSVGFGLLLIAGCGDDSVAVGSGSEGGDGGDSAGTPSTSAATEGSAGDSGSGSTSTGSGDTGSGDGTAGGTAGGTDTDGGPMTVRDCFEDQYVNGFALDPNYDALGAVPGSHCHGTDHQDIEGVQRVVFLGDSITVGTPPTPTQTQYRSIVADGLADRFGLSFGPDELLWKLPNVVSGTSVIRDSGDFSNCSEYGGRNEDLMDDGTQMVDCFPEDRRDLVTLVIVTMGGNDIQRISKDAIDGVPLEQLTMDMQAAVDLKREAMEWITAPGRFPNGVFVVFGNIYEFTDGTADVQSCQTSQLFGFEDAIPAPAQVAGLAIQANQQYMQIALDTGTDMVFMAENFCGHGFQNQNPAAPCYRGPGAERWFDFTCIHPNPPGHEALAEFFLAVVDE